MHDNASRDLMFQGGKVKVNVVILGINFDIALVPHIWADFNITSYKCLVWQCLGHVRISALYVQGQYHGYYFFL